MNTECLNVDPLKGTKWEDLTLPKYCNEMSDDEREELKEHLENINAPFAYEVDDDINEEGDYKTWRDIVSMSDEELDKYWEESR